MNSTPVEEAKDIADSSRLVPPYNPDAERPDDVYALHDIIPEVEFNAVPVNMFKSAKTQEDRLAVLPLKGSKWLKLQLSLAYAAPKPNKSTLCVFTISHFSWISYSSPLT